MEDFFENLKTVIGSEFPGATVERDEALGPKRAFIVEITWDGFANIPDADRQDKVWEVISNNFQFEEYKRVAFVITWTDSEKAAYAE